VKIEHQNGPIKVNKTVIRRRLLMLEQIITEHESSVQNLIDDGDLMAAIKIRFEFEVSEE